MSKPDRVLVAVGLIGPAVLTLMLVLLSVIQAEFMRGLGWHPLRAATFDWPSGLSLGPYGRWMTATFIFCGVSIIGLASQVHRLAGTRVVALAMCVAGAGMCGLAFDTDPTLTTVVPTWHGRLHDLSFAVLGLGLASTWLATLFRLRASAPRLWVLTVLAFLCVPLGFIVRGLGFYIFLAVALFWFQLLAVVLWRLPQSGGPVSHV